MDIKKSHIITGVLIITFLLGIVYNTGPTTHGMKKIKTGVIKAVVLGDSIALSARATNPSATGWTGNLDSELKNAYPFGKIHWTILGLNGSGVDYAIERTSDLMKDTDVVYICTGRNDAKGYPYATFKSKYTKLIMNVKKAVPHIDIICIIEPPMVSTDDSAFNVTRKAAIDSAQETNTLVVDTWAEFPKERSQLESLLYDGLHPNDSGYKLISKCVFEVMHTHIGK